MASREKVTSRVESFDKSNPAFYKRLSSAPLDIVNAGITSECVHTRTNAENIIHISGVITCNKIHCTVECKLTIHGTVMIII